MKKAVKSIGVLLACCFALTSVAQKTIDTIATKVDGYDIPIRIKLPKNTNGKNPVYFFVHGGGWNGGDSTHVPPARMHNDANYLADQLVVIYVGLAYRCKGNNATFSDAIKDLEASVKWFFDNADTYNADLTRIGFGTKAVITGDVTQIDLAKGQLSGLIEIQKILKKIKGIEFTHFSAEDVVRHPLVQKIITAYEKHENVNTT